jgi:hypothetical protein
MGYYGGLLKVDSMKSLQLILSTCILGRRSFRIFKSVNHIQLLILKLDKLSKKNVFLSIQDRIYVIECVEALEQLFWVRQTCIFAEFLTISDSLRNCVFRHPRHYSHSKHTSNLHCTFCDDITFQDGYLILMRTSLCDSQLLISTPSSYPLISS